MFYVFSTPYVRIAVQRACNGVVSDRGRTSIDTKPKIQFHVQLFVLSLD